ncbi:MAG: class I SAM-dependent methyltransferase [Methylococcus sp.]
MVGNFPNDRGLDPTWLPAPSREQGHFVFWAAAGLAQTGEVDKARALIREALSAGGDRRAAARLLLGSAYVRLGRAALLAGQAERALRGLREGLRLGVPGGASLFLDLLRAEAERCSRRGETREAVQRWQDIATLLGAETPAWVYERLSAAYANNHQGFGGTPEENHCWGDAHKHELLSRFHERLAPRLYLEIGVDQGLSLARALGPAIGVDPRPRLELRVTLGAQTRILPLSSDAFFRTAAAECLQPPPDLVFIDGMHLFEFVLRDFMNVERHAHPATLVVIDDIFPCHPTQASRRRRSTAWTGDVWKLHAVLRVWRPDLTLIALNAHTTGLLLIAGLDPGNTVLHDQYEALVRQWAWDMSVPAAALTREGVLPSDHPVAAALLDTLRQARDEGWEVTRVRESLRESVLDKGQWTQ